MLTWVAEAENDEMSRFYDKVFDLMVSEGYAEVVDQLRQPPSDQSPYKDDPNDRPTGDRLTQDAVAKDNADLAVKTVFNPAQPSDVCVAWSSMEQYCGGSSSNMNFNCACYSKTYHVPDMWNSLAAGCASIATTCTAGDDSNACKIHSAASSMATYCPTTSAVSFAYYDNHPAPTTTADDSSGSDDDSGAAAAGQGATTTASATTTPDVLIVDGSTVYNHLTDSSGAATWATAPTTTTSGSGSPGSAVADTSSGSDATGKMMILARAASAMIPAGFLACLVVF